MKGEEEELTRKKTKSNSLNAGVETRSGRGRTTESGKLQRQRRVEGSEQRLCSTQVGVLRHKVLTGRGSYNGTAKGGSQSHCSQSRSPRSYSAWGGRMFKLPKNCNGPRSNAPSPVLRRSLSQVHLCLISLTQRVITETHLRTLLYSGSQRISKDIVLSSCHTSTHKLIIYGLFHKNSRPGYTALALMIEDANVRKLHRSIHCKEIYTQPCLCFPL